jgi:hypothetical protein
VLLDGSSTRDLADIPEKMRHAALRGSCFVLGVRTMTERSTRRTVTFARPFVLDGFDQELPAGKYVVETDEELLQGLSFPVYRRVSTTFYVDVLPGRPGQREAWQIDPEALDAALIRDRTPL